VGSYDESRDLIWIDDLLENPGSQRYGEHPHVAYLDIDWVDRMTSEYRRAGRELVGHYHSHNRYEGKLAAESPTDRKNWRSWAAASELPMFAGVIVHRSNRRDEDDASGWLHPHFSAFVFKPDRPEFGGRRSGSRTSK
jgi:hypothetical protein